MEETLDKNIINENSYEIFSNNLKNSISSKYNKYNCNYDYIINDFITDGYSIILDNNNDFYVQYTNSELNNKYGKYKISENVLNFNLVKTGQNGVNMLYYINEDGTVSSADTEYSVANNEEITIKNNIGNYKNIVSIIDDTFGNVYSENLTN